MPTTDQPLLAYSDTGSGSPVLALHGLGGSRNQLAATLSRALAGRSTRVLAPDLRGHGRSELPEDPVRLRIATMAGDVVALLDALDIDRVRGVGISMGAAILLELAATAPERLESAILIRPAWLWTPAPQNLDVLSDMGRYLAQAPINPDQRLAGWQSDPARRRLSAQAPAVARALDDLVLAEDAIRRAARFWAVPASAPTRPDHVGPWAVLVTTEDPIHPDGLGIELARELGAPWQRLPARYSHPLDYEAALSAALAAGLAL